MSRKKLDSVDLAWLRLDRPENLMMITSLIIFEKPLDYEWVKRKIEATVSPFRRFRQCLIRPGKPFQKAYWQDDPNFTINNHFEKIDLADPDDENALMEFINSLLAVSLDQSRPLWHFSFIETYRGGCAIVARVHHTIADGISLMQVLMMALEKGPVPNAGTSLVQTNLIDRNRRKRLQEPGKLKRAGKLLTHPSLWVSQTEKGIGFITALIKLAFRPADPRTLLKGTPGIQKRATWSRPLDMQTLRDLGKCYDCMVNDILAAIIAGGLGRYFESRGEATKNLTIRSFIMVNLRPLELDEELGNKFGIVYLHMPLGIRDYLERLTIMKKDMDMLKSSREAAATYFVLRLLGSLPTILEALAIRFFNSKGSLVMTNVPGPKRPLYFADSPVETIMAWIPQSGTIGLGFSVVSYNGKAIIGISADSGLVPEPESIMSFIYKELEALEERRSE